jgi:hypothetical protein
MTPARCRPTEELSAVSFTSQASIIQEYKSVRRAVSASVRVYSARVRAVLAVYFEIGEDAERFQ